ncbi:hypothetical protein [Pantoea agglomerans]|uniref:hypothetical protein n=1 Tax=Enterobacter agglomerans TaxID=549 RepID=UPI00301D2512
MALYNISNKTLTPLERTTFSIEGLQERYDLQEAIKNNIAILAPDCLVISEEFSNWEDSRRRIDILAIDKQANLIVIELKRDEFGAHMELQALRYAAMISTMSFSKACEYYQDHLSKHGIEIDAREAILDFVELQDNELNEFGKDVRIILASAGFSKELTTTVIWLRDKGVDISCVKITPYNFKGDILINAEQIIPVPELNEYQVRFREKRTEQIASQSKTEKDYSSYKYKGLVFNKRKLALEVFTDWIKKENPASLEDIKSKLEGVIKNRTIALANSVSESRISRYYMNDAIQLASGELVAISNQWSVVNIDRIINFFRQYGFVVEKIESE